jgi:hypothetical protein
MSTDDFKLTWAFPSEIKKELGASSYDIRVTPGTYKSGRQRFICDFLDANRNVICTREAMELVSKVSRKLYHVVKRAPEVPHGQAAKAQLARNGDASAQFGLNDLY